MEVRTSKIGTIDDLPEQLEVIDGSLVVIGTSESPTFPDFEGKKVTLIPRDYMVWLIKSRDLLDRQLRINNAIESIQYTAIVVEKEDDPAS